jgi:hypothetical protein
MGNLSVKAFVKLDAPHPRSARPPLTPGFAPRTTRRRSLTRIRVSAQEPAIQVRTRRLRHKITTLGTPGLQSPRNYSYETESAFSSQYEVELRRSRLGAPNSAPEV